MELVLFSDLSPEFGSAPWLSARLRSPLMRSDCLLESTLDDLKMFCCWRVVVGGGFCLGDCCFDVGEDLVFVSFVVSSRECFLHLLPLSGWCLVEVGICRQVI